jgi:hypothetical protein
MERGNQSAQPPDAEGGPGSADANERAAMWRDFRAAAVVTVVSALLIVFLWLISHNAPSAGSDPNLTPLVAVSTRVPTRVATAVGTPVVTGRATPVATAAS